MYKKVNEIHSSENDYIRLPNCEVDSIKRLITTILLKPSLILTGH